MMNSRTFLRWTIRVVVLGILLSALSVLAVVIALRSSLAQLDGNRRLEGLEAQVVIERDAEGAPTLRARGREDAAQGLGFLHAQDRFFQMDLLRRSAAGELAELLGPGVIGLDEAVRVHRFRTRMRARFATLPPEQRAVLLAYAAGVNAGLGALGARPPEYFLLRARPARWEPEDSLLVGCAMSLALHDSRGYEDAHQAHLRAALPGPAAAFFGPQGWSWEAPLDDSVSTAPAVPSPQEFQARGSGETRPGSLPAEPDDASTVAFVRRMQASVLGSNSWAVSGRRSPTGGAVVANDMHLELNVPSTWYRARLIYRDSAVGDQDLVGVTLPGVPVMVVGSNRHVAWAFTFATVDATDLIRLEIDPAKTNRYRTPSGWRDLEVHVESIRVKGGSNVVLSVQETVWGPVVPSLGLPGQYALAWAFHHPEAVNLNHLDLERCRSVGEAIDVAPTIGTPVNNFVVGDREGRIGYTLIGRVPERFGFDGAVPVSWADGTCGWRGLLPAARYPRWVDPPEGVLWTANNRTLGTPAYLALNPAYQDLGARARQIRDDLRSLKQADETALWQIYLDDRAIFLERWQALLVATLDRQTNRGASMKILRDSVADWGGRAAAGSVGYRVVREFRHQAMQLLFEPMRDRVQKQASWMWVGNDDAAWAMLKERPRHLLGARFTDYGALLEEAVARTARAVLPDPAVLLPANWGEVNALRMQHPISRAVPQLARWLDMARVPMSGDGNMPRVLEGGAGVSERLVVSPGREEQGFFNMPGGQSGHFLSPYYRAGHDAWVATVPQPLLPGPTRHALVLEPGGRGAAQGSGARTESRRSHPTSAAMAQGPRTPGVEGIPGSPSRSR